MLRSLFFLLFLVSAAKADDYYCMFFATDSISPRYPHVWGTFVHMKNQKLQKQVTISWNPVSWNILDRKKSGYHLSLHESMELSGDKYTCIWGPYRIHQKLFDKAEKQFQNEGYYKLLDAFSRPNSTNCIHKLTDITGHKAITHVRYGKFAANSVYKHYNKLGLIHPAPDYSKVISALDLDKYYLNYR